ncbi:MAG TPA: transporter [Candidatus Limnocylindria bacterium]|nr:transporter [Candidatus Limnocylindria bacterium]HTL66258.1 transporter [Lacunisphaera sp.]
MLQPIFARRVGAANTLRHPKSPPSGRPASRLGTALLLAASLALAPLLRAADAPKPFAPPPEDERLDKVNGIFDTDLPWTEAKGRIKIIIHPHLGDFTRRSYIRVPVGARLGVNDHVEFSAMVDPFFDHGLRQGSSGNGVGDVQFGAKYAFLRWLKPDYDASIGLNVNIPTGHPPLEMTDGYDHYAPYIVIGRQSRKFAGLQYFASTTYDHMEKSSVRGMFQLNEPHSSNLLFGTGFVLDRFPFHYTLEVGFQTTSLVGRGNKQFAYIRPGFAWNLPRRYTFYSDTRWLVGVSVKVADGPDGLRVDSGGKVRAEFSFQRWLARRNGADPGATR